MELVPLGDKMLLVVSQCQRENKRVGSPHLQWLHRLDVFSGGPGGIVIGIVELAPIEVSIWVRRLFMKVERSTYLAA